MKMNYWQNNEKARKTLNWRPKHSLEEGIFKTLNWYGDLIKER